jgi:O-antigen ligase
MLYVAPRCRLGETLMFSDEIPSLRSAWTLEPGAAAIGALIGIAGPALLVSPRLAVFLLPIIAVYSLWSRFRVPDHRAAPISLDSLTVSIGALVLYALARACWVAEPVAGAGKVLQIGIIAFASIATVRCLSTESRERLLRMSEGLWLGFALGLAFYLVEALSHQGVKIWLINTLNLGQGLLPPGKSFIWQDGRVLGMGIADFTRGATPITLLLWPALMAALGSVVRPWNARVAVLILALAISAVLVCPQESSKAAIIAGGAAFGLAQLSGRWAARSVAALWVVACFAVVPAALLAHRMDLHNAPWLQSSARHRIVIWNYTAERALEAPIFGVGPYMTYLRGLQLSANAVSTPDEPFERSLSRHAHNVYLQTWFELGAVGAALLMAAGLAIIHRIQTFGTTILPFALATFSSAATLLASSYGMWQTWFVALFGLTPIFFTVGSRVLETAQSYVARKAP